MSKLVKLILGNRDSENTFHSVILEIWNDGILENKLSNAKLPSASKIGTLYGQWEKYYSALNFPHRSCSRENENQGTKIDPSYPTNISHKGFRELSQQLREEINTWLDFPDFAKQEEQLRTLLHHEDKISLIIETSDSLLQQIPWHLWDFFDGFSRGGVALSTSNYKRINPNIIFRKKPKILVILGHGKELNTNEDKKHLEDILEDGNITPLIEPSCSELCKNLREKEGWDIVFFAGHSDSDLDLNTGYIEINSKEEKLALEDLENALQESIYNGLQLVIFNSCSGLGLAQHLAKLNIPQTIVMREKILDSVAPLFLKYFLEDFYKGQSLLLSVRQAQNRLKDLEKNSPGVSWLPVVFKNPTEEVLSWNTLHGVRKQKEKWKKWKLLILGVVSIGLPILVVFLGQIFIPKYQPIGDYLSIGEEMFDETDPNYSKKQATALVGPCVERGRKISLHV